MVEVNDEYTQQNKKITFSDDDVPVGPEEFHYSCKDDECLYPLPGNPPYEITNPNPDLYEIYFVTGSQDQDETLVKDLNQKFNEFGNIKVRNNSEWTLYNSKAELIHPIFTNVDFIYEYDSGNIVVENNGKSTLYNPQAELIHPNFEKVDYIFEYENGNIEVQNNGKEIDYIKQPDGTYKIKEND